MFPIIAVAAAALAGATAISASAGSPRDSDAPQQIQAQNQPATNPVPQASNQAPARAVVDPSQVNQFVV